MTATDADLKAAIAVNRFGLGARPGEIAAVRADPRGWLISQIRPQGVEPLPGVPAVGERMRAYTLFDRERKEKRKTGEKPSPEIAAAALDTADQDALARMRLAVTTSAGFQERWTHFWANHFTVAWRNMRLGGMVGPFEQTAIRPNVFGDFRTLLGAAATHPTMLTYLDQIRAKGPNSPAVKRGGKAVGLNENLAREILELHTLGIDGGYSQADVTEFARALTGFTAYQGLESKNLGQTRFNKANHEPGVRKLMGKTYAQEGRAQPEAIFDDLARHPSTAKHLATKLARHFHSDDPPPTLVERLARTFKRSNGRLDAVAAALIDSPEMWQPKAAKFKTPYEFMVSGWRALGAEPTEVEAVTGPLLTLGQPTFRPPSPKGWDDLATLWCSPDGMVKRMAVSRDFGEAYGDTREPLALARAALGAGLTPRAETAVARAESRGEGVAILLMSPEFQRR